MKFLLPLMLLSVQVFATIDCKSLVDIKYGELRLLTNDQETQFTLYGAEPYGNGNPYEFWRFIVGQSGALKRTESQLEVSFSNKDVMFRLFKTRACPLHRSGNCRMGSIQANTVVNFLGINHTPLPLECQL